MMRRTFRLGLRAGLLAGIVFALIKIMQARRPSQEGAAPSSAWPLVPAPKPTTSATPTPRTAPPTPTDAAEPGIERPAASPAATKLAPEPLVPVKPSGSAPASPSAPAPGAVTQQPAGRVRPLKATKAPAKAAIAPAKATKKAAKAAETPPANRAWIAPISDDLCPQSHPVKAKLSSRIFHLPGGQNYARCRPDRCYETEQAAQADGFSRAQR